MEECVALVQQAAITLGVLHRVCGEVEKEGRALAAHTDVRYDI